MPPNDRRGFSRRRFLGLSAGTAAAGSAGWHFWGRGKPQAPPSDGWWGGDLAHILPTVNHQRFIVKVSFHSAPPSLPLLHLDQRIVEGRQTDSDGLFYRFDVDGLQAAKECSLQLKLADGSALCAPWPLKTFPAPDQAADSFRLLAYTCAGGPDTLYNYGFFNAYLPNPTRQRLFARALSFAPDAVVANGDHVYWDLKSSRFMGNSWRATRIAGKFDRNQAVLGTPNERVLKRAFGPQIAGLYGLRFRSTPMFFLQDDHDYGENDEADATLRTFPADPFMLDLARSTQQLYYPELLSSPDLPAPYQQREGYAENFGTLRFGQLFEGLLYDCRRYMSNELDPATTATTSRFLPEDIENWLCERSANSPARHIAHMPSTPVLWTAGKWAEWYPDAKLKNGSLGTTQAKPYWPKGWQDQHDRLLSAAVARRDRQPLFISGDLHATGSGRILGNREHSYRHNPVYSILSGAIGTGVLGWPSKFRGTKPKPASELETDIVVEPREENGFSVIDFSTTAFEVRQFAWKPDQGDALIDTLEPFARYQVAINDRNASAEENRNA